MTLIELIIASSLSILALLFFSTLLSQNSKAMVRARTRIYMLSQETLMSQLFADSRSCHCTFDMGQVLNPYRALNAGAGLKVGGSAPIPMNSLDVYRMDDSGTCSYAPPNVMNIASVGTPLSDDLSHLEASGIFIRDLVKIGDITPAVGQYRGTIEVRYTNIMDPTDMVNPMLANFIFYVDMTTNQSIGCDITAAVKDAYVQSFQAMIDDQVTLTSTHTDLTALDMDAIWATFQARINDLITNHGYSR